MNAVLTDDVVKTSAIEGEALNVESVRSSIARRLGVDIGALTPTDRSEVGEWRDNANGPMQVVSGAIGRQRVHFEGPPADHLEAQTNRFLTWVNGPINEPALLKAGIAHLWFVTLHPFDDGNGRIGRAIGDLLLARADGSTRRFYSLSAQIQKDRQVFAGYGAERYWRTCDQRDVTQSRGRRAKY